MSLPDLSRPNATRDPEHSWEGELAPLDQADGPACWSCTAGPPLHPGHWGGHEDAQLCATCLERILDQGQA